MGVFPTGSDLCGRRFLVYIAYRPQYPFAISASMSAVLLIVDIVQLTLSATAFISLCLGTVSFSCIPLCRNSFWRSLLRNSLPQSAWINLTLYWGSVAFPVC